MTRSTLTRIICAVAALSLIAAAAAFAEPGKGERTIFDLLMPNQAPASRISNSNPPRQIVEMLQDIFDSVQKVDLWTYDVSSGAKADELLRGYERTLSAQGWERRIAQGPGRGFDGVYSHDTKPGPFELMLIEIRANFDQTRVSFTKIAGVKGGGSVTPRTPTVRKETPRSITTLRISASGPSLQYQSWQQEIVEVNRVVPGGQLPLPEILTQGSIMGFELAAGSIKGRPNPMFDMQPFGRGSSGLDFSIRAPQRLIVMLETTGSPVTVNMDGIKQLNVKATNASVTILGMPTDASHSIEAVNQKVVLSLGAMKSGELRVKATSADVTVTLPKSSNVDISANAVAGAVNVRAPGAEPQTKSPAKLSVGAGQAKLILESVSGNITVIVK